MAQLILGWQLTPMGAPRYWLNAEAKPGKQSSEDLVTVDPSHMATHTVVVAQTGSGKSYFLGRLIEELILRTKARCVILDPNADFRMISSLAPLSMWRNARFDVTSGLGHLPHERSGEEFKTHWNRVPKAVLTKRTSSIRNHVKFQVWWPRIDAELLFDVEDPVLQSELSHCHSYVAAIGDILRLTKSSKTTDLGLLSASEELVWKAKRSTRGEGRQPSIASIQETLGKKYDTEQLVKAAIKLFESDEDPDSVDEQFYRDLVNESLRKAALGLNYVSDQAAKFYFAKLREYDASGIIAHTMTRRDEQRARINVLDLPAFERPETRRLAVYALLASEWATARSRWNRALRKPENEDDRVPTFIVIDEAHKLAPAEVTTRAGMALREQVRTIAAEGRKFGLFLILASQRPDKLDPVILSECGNKAIMRFDSELIVQDVQARLGLADVPQRSLQRCVTFGPGRVLIAGRWAPSQPKEFLCAARRTVEGGRNLRSEHWTVP